MASQRVRDALAVTLLLAASLPLALLARHIAYDDAWITYRYAWNLAAGNGFVYNVGERFLGTSAPGYAVLLALGGIFSPSVVPTVSGLICAASLVATGLGLYTFGRSSDDWLVGLVAGLLFVCSPVTIEAFGGEMTLQVALIVWAFAAEAHRRWMWAVMLAVAATLVRPDGIVPLALIGVHQTWARRELPWREMVAAGVVLALWHGSLWLYFGAPMPQTVGAKSAQRLSGIWRPFGSDLKAWFQSMSVFPTPLFTNRPVGGFTATLVLAAVGVPALLWTRRWWLVLAWPVAYMLVYRQLHLPFYHWYALAPFLAIVMAAGAAVSVSARLAARALSRPAAAEIVAVLLVVGAVAWPTFRYSVADTRLFPNDAERAYEAAGRWFAANTPRGASIGYLEIGIIGYYAQRPIVDPLGLVNAGVAPHVAQRDFLWAYSHFRPDYIVHNPVFFPEQLGIVRDQPWFKAEYEPVAQLESGRGDGIPLTIYRRTVRQ